jgi:hypothetical protein
LLSKHHENRAKTKVDLNNSRVPFNIENIKEDEDGTSELDEPILPDKKNYDEDINTLERSYSAS